MALKKRLTSQQFEQAARTTTLRPHTLEMAREVIVCGQSQSKVAKIYGVSKSAVSQVVKQVWDAHSPPGFVVVSIPLPESLAPLISHISEYALLHPDHFHASYSQESFQSVLQSLTKGAGDS